ncbi:hypothetical protein EYF80_055927 [Liparis tanakae]|uniref:Uncharacterized protein n=1 Tax=Liparis tanakae TaxID=230148 RepID=A0A4Z2EYR6_9TELE|nr:hypothetical protein EYF80_055927 [Liparis tanakae]
MPSDDTHTHTGQTGSREIKRNPRSQVVHDEERRPSSRRGGARGLGPIKQIISDRAFESIRGLKKNFLKNQACLSLRTQTEIRANEPGSPITLIIRTQHQRTDLNLLEPSAAAAAAAGPGVDLRLRGRPGPRRAGLRDFSSFLRREEDEEEEGERERERERDQRCRQDSRRNQEESCIGYSSASWTRMESSSPPIVSMEPFTGHT